MIYYLTKFLIEEFDFPRLFLYITSRTFFAGITSLLLSLFIGNHIIKLLHRHGIKDRPRELEFFGISKKGTPTMGGLIILFAGGISALLWCRLDNKFVQLLFLSIIWFATLGMVDDFFKIKGGAEAGLARPAKLISQLGFGLLLAFFVLRPDISPFPEEFIRQLHVPFYKYPLMELPLLLYALFIILFVGFVTNAVNITDGMDGLAIVPATLNIVVYGVFAYILGHAYISRYLLYPFIPGSQEIAVFSAAVAGAGVGFLWYNSYPAQVFLGDTGSLLLGGYIATAAVLLKQEALFVISGGVFVIELLSSFVQDYIGIKLLKRRIFYRAPLHHTFQHMGWAETKIVVRFWIISVLLALFAVATLKIR